MRTVSPRRLLALAILAGGVMSGIRPAEAVQTERWELKTTADFRRGKLQRLILSSDGELRPGYGSQRLGEFAKEIWCSTTGPDGTVYFGTGSPADVYAAAPGEEPVKLIETDTVAITALALDGRGNLYAATLAEGLIFRIDLAQKKGSEFCRLTAPYVWALLADGPDGLFAGTGPEGKIYRIGPEGEAEEWYRAEETNILCLARDADGRLLAGGSDRGLLYQIAAKAQGTVLHQFAEDEVKAVAVRGREVYIGVNKQKVRRPRGAARRPSAAEFSELTQRLTTQFGGPEAAPAAERGRETPPQARMGNLLAGTLYLRSASGRIDRWADWDDESILDLAVDADGQALLAMAGAGRVYRVRGVDDWELLFDFDEQQALALAMREGRLTFVGTGNAGSAYRIDFEKAGDGEYQSEVRDCRFATTWGNLSWLGQGAIEVATRTGNTGLPDATWSDWSEPLKLAPGAVRSPAARFIQLRARLTDAGPTAVRSLTLYYQVQNQKPELLSLDVGERAKPAPEKPKKETAGEESVGAPTESKEPEKKSEEVRPKKPSPVKRIRWQANDQDGDTLVYRLYYRSQDEKLWIAMPWEKPLKTTDYSWDTQSIPDGWYAVKAEASDEESNPVGQAITAEKISDLVKVDNRPPEVLELAFDAATGALSGSAQDSLSFLSALEFSVDGGPWKFLAPRDGVFDDREEAFEVKIDPLPAGPHSLAVRATDEEGNIGVEKIAVPRQ